VSPMMTCSRADQSVHAEEKGRKASGEATVIVILVPPRSMNALLASMHTNQQTPQGGTLSPQNLSYTLAGRSDF